MDFKKEFTFKERKEDADRVLNKYPDRVPIICERNKRASKDCPNIDKKKFLVPKDLTMGQFLYVIRHRLKLPSEKAIFLFASNLIVSGSANINEIYNLHADEDGFLYITYCLENVFGSNNSTLCNIYYHHNINISH